MHPADKPGNQQMDTGENITFLAEENLKMIAMYKI